MLRSWSATRGSDSDIRTAKFDTCIRLKSTDASFGRVRDTCKKGGTSGHSLRGRVSCSGSLRGFLIPPGRVVSVSLWRLCTALGSSDWPRELAGPTSDVRPRSRWTLTSTASAARSATRHAAAAAGALRLCPAATRSNAWSPPLRSRPRTTLRLPGRPRRTPCLCSARPHRTPCLCSALPNACRPLVLRGLLRGVSVSASVCLCLCLRWHRCRWPTTHRYGTIHRDGRRVGLPTRWRRWRR